MLNTSMKIQLMQRAPVRKALLSLGLPTMIGMLVGALYNVVDAFYVGRLGPSQMASVAVVFPIIQTIIGIGMTFGSGAGSYISRLLGENNSKKANIVASTGLFSSLGFGICFIVVALIFLDPLLKSLGATSTILPYAKIYATIYIAGAIFNIFNVTMNNIVVSEGATKLTMMAMLISALLNIILDPIFIYTFNLGVSGAAIATIIAQSVSSIMYLLYIVLKKGVLRFSFLSFRPDKLVYVEILKIGIPTLVFQLLVSISMGLTNNVASQYGDAVVAAYGIVIRIITIGMYIVYGYMKGFQPFAGYNYGAKQYTRLQEGIKQSITWSGWFCGIISLLLILFANPIIGAFCNFNPAVLSVGVVFLRTNAITFSFFGYISLYSVLFLALGMEKKGSILSISRQGLFYIPILLVLPQWFGLNGIYYAQPFADFATLLLSWLFVRQLKKSILPLEKKNNEQVFYYTPDTLNKLCK
jgi:putative MATE family efflux protein